MPNLLISASSLMFLLAAPAAAPQPTWNMATELLQQHVVIHVPRVTISTMTVIMRAPRAPALVEKKAGDCVKMEKLAGFTVNRFDSVDLVLKDGSLLRAKLGADCPALGFYTGFYVRPTKDQKICAKRDSLRSRSGRWCGVQAFTTLVPAR